MASTSSSPQSSLGQLGKALLKFLKPILKAKPHSIEVNAAPLVQLPSDIDSTATKQSNEQNSQVPSDASKALGKNTQAPPKPGTEGSGVISVKRDPSTPWVNVVIGLIEACGKSSGQARSLMGTNAYQAASSGSGALAKGTIGRMVDLRTIISEEQQDDDTNQEPKREDKESKLKEDSEKKKAS